MSSLADAIGKVTGNLTVDEEGDSFILDRSVFASRKRANQSTVTKGNDEREVTKEGLVDNYVEKDFNFWKEKYFILHEEREQDVKDLEAELELSVTLQKELERKNEVLKKRIDLSDKSGAGADVTHNNSSLETPVETELLVAQVDKYKKIVALYEAMTSMVVKLGGDGEKDYICTVKNKRKRIGTRFVITVNNNETTTTPAEDGENATAAAGEETCFDFVPKANVSLLPEYARAQISFEPSMAPVLMGDILQEMFREEDVTEEEEEEQQEEEQQLEQNI